MSVSIPPAPPAARSVLGVVRVDPRLHHFSTGNPVPDFESNRLPAHEERRRLQALTERERAAGVRETTDPLERVCRALTSELDLEGVVVTLMPTLDTHAVAAISGDAVLLHEELQFGLGEGPTQDAYSSGRPVLVADLELGAAERWPAYAPAALEAGVRGVYAFPLHVGVTIFGALTLYAQRPRTLDRHALRTALSFAELATEIMVDRSSAGLSDHLDPRDHEALATHGHIYQAQGMVMVDLGVTLPEALARMRAHAYAAGQDLATLATDIIDGRTRLPRDRPRVGDVGNEDDETDSEGAGPP